MPDQTGEHIAMHTILGCLGLSVFRHGWGEFMSNAFWYMDTMCQDPAGIVHIEASQSCLCIVGTVCEAGVGPDQNGEHTAMHTILGRLGLQ